ncbi:MAG: hypothetical protein ACOX2F_08560 [bacterium]
MRKNFKASVVIIMLLVLSSCGHKSTDNDNDSSLNDDDIETGNKVNDEVAVNINDWLEIKTEKIDIGNYKDVIGKKKSKWNFEEQGFFRTFKTLITKEGSFVTGIYVSENGAFYISGLICDGVEESECSFLTILYSDGERTDFYLKKHTEGSFSSKVTGSENGDEVFVLLNYAGKQGEEFDECRDNRVFLISLNGSSADSGVIIEPILDKCHKCYDVELLNNKAVLVCLTESEKYKKTTDILLVGSKKSFKMSEKLYEYSSPFHTIKNKESISLFGMKMEDGGLEYIEHSVIIKNGEIGIRKAYFDKPEHPVSVRRIAYIGNNRDRIFCGDGYMVMKSKPAPFENIIWNSFFGTSTVFDKSNSNIKMTRVITNKLPDSERVYGNNLSSISYIFEEEGTAYFTGYSTFDIENRAREWSPFFSVSNPIPVDMLTSTFVYAEKNGSIYARQLISNIIPEYPLILVKKNKNIYVTGVYLDLNYRQGVFIHEISADNLINESFLSRSSTFAVCGNGDIEPGEKCDGDSLCTMVSDSYSGGTAKCVMCESWDTKECVQK